ncbi:hypothetical protein GJ744_008964 [Endocarpon pusillum]|uniref:Uncharacterized protein n=1 Tax=Endocarpon pusillum TaxID=364733 RepID=A0A8H7AKN5_9EURO|nr:hypothetical protein GJ744_008964 [Endocarpon pusillum]
MLSSVERSFISIIALPDMSRLKANVEEQTREGGGIHLAYYGKISHTSSFASTVTDCRHVLPIARVL